MIRVMTIEDYDQVYALWKKIKGFGIRSIDDSREGSGALPEAESVDQCSGRGGWKNCGKYPVRS